MSSTASPFLVTDQNRSVDPLGDVPAASLPATPAVNLLRVTCGLTQTEAENLLARADEAIGAGGGAPHNTGSRWDHTASYALIGIAGVVASQLLFG